MHKLLVFSLFISLGIFTIAQKSSLTGFIVDSEDDEPLIGASVKVIGLNIGSVTDLSGKFKITNLKN